ncbi:MAG TPA: hypothetical protein P5205_21735 [Candidatus Paceibacterota bacterium]|nr:hypothetical protein [Verrucomicrobiota bacterium]HSA12984.1 hypothetical protein [Candidatus Paceibacterota bacterium]
MKVELPEQMKSDMSLARWGEILPTTPVVMAVVPTMLAIAFGVHVYPCVQALART